MNLTIPNLTDEQVASIKSQLGVTPVPPATAGTWLEYDGAFLGHKHVSWTASVSPSGPEAKPYPEFTKYDTTTGHSPIAQPGDVTGTANWGGSIEYHRIQQAPIAGVRWGMLDGFSSASVAGSFYPIETVQTQWINVDSGAILDITPPPPAPQGHPYCIFDIPASGHFRRRVWGWIWNSMTTGRSRPFFSQSDFWFGLIATNPSWTGAMPMRECVKESDAWWDNGTWVHATGGVPFDANNNPIDPGVLTYTGHDILGRGAGAGWEYAYEGWIVGVATITDTAG